MASQSVVPSTESTERVLSAVSALIVAVVKPVSATVSVANVVIAIRSAAGFASMNARAAAVASASGWPAIDRERSMTSMTLFARPRFSAESPAGVCPSSVSFGERTVGASVTTLTLTVG